MPYPDQPPHPAGALGDPESVHRVYLSTDVRPAIGAATAAQMRGALTEITWHLYRQLTGLPGADAGEFSQACQAGSGTRAGVQLYHQAVRAVSDHYLQALGFDPARAAGDATYRATAIGPFLRAARKHRLRRALLRLADCLDATVRDADATADATARARLPEDVWEVGTGVTTAIGLYRHAVRVVSVHVLFYLWDALDITGQPQPHAFRPFGDSDFLATRPN